jgi:sulfur-oxidizing protein SoxY
MRWMRREILGHAAWLALPAWYRRAAAREHTGGDPLGSTQWPQLRREFAGTDAVRFAPQVVVRAPQSAEDAMNVPVMVDARLLGRGVRLVRVVVDRNPIRHVLDFEPLRALPVLGFRVRLEQGSPVRALVQDVDGHWWAGGVWVQAAGGGCTVPGVTRSDGSWSRTLNEVQARLFGNVLEGSRRLRIRIMHPMDTGLVAGIPAFHIESLELSDAAGEPVCRLALHEPVAENPLLTFELPRELEPPLRLSGRDNNGNRIEARVAA